jgi:hypothetical protein
MYSQRVRTLETKFRHAEASPPSLLTMTRRGRVSGQAVNACFSPDHSTIAIAWGDHGGGNRRRNRVIAWDVAG